MTFNEFLEKYNLRIKDVSDLFGIPYRTVENWKRGKSPCQEHWLKLMDFALRHGYGEE